MPEAQLILAVLVGIALLLFLILKLKLQAFLSLLIASIATGLIAGMPAADILASMTKGMGDTLGFVATIVGLGALFGAILEYSGGAQSVARYLLRRLGVRRAPLAMTIAGFIVAIPVFFDVAFIILVPLIYALQKRSGKSLLLFGIPLLAGLVVTHAFIPPTPGPVAVADILGADLGYVILLGCVAGIPSVIFGGLVFGKWISERIDIAVPEYIEMRSEPPENPPSAGQIVLIIALPIVLIVAQTLVARSAAGASLREVMTLAGHPFSALIIANIVAWYVLGIRRGFSREALSEISVKSLAPAGLIILLTGAGGVFKQILIDTGAGTMLAESMSGLSALPVLFAFLIALLVRIMQGSATVAMITAAGMTAPALTGQSDLQLAVLVIAIAAGASAASHVNDSGFWLVNRYLGLTEKQTLRSWTLMTTIVGVTGLVMALAISLMI